MNEKTIVENLLAQAGIEVNGGNPRDITVNNQDFYHRVLASGSLGLGESYMDGWWDCEHLDEFFPGSSSLTSKAISSRTGACWPVRCRPG